jgi:transketolase
MVAHYCRNVELLISTGPVATVQFPSVDTQLSEALDLDPYTPCDSITFGDCSGDTGTPGPTPCWVDWRWVNWDCCTGPNCSRSTIAAMDAGQIQPALTGRSAERKRHPTRIFNVGVAEQNMFSIAAGLASAGLMPYAGTFAAYAALLACEQIRTDIAYTGMPVRILAPHSGMSLGFYGSSHHALEDIGIMRTLADLTVVCAADSNELRAILRASASHPGPIYIRLGRGRDPDVYDQLPRGFRIGKAIRIREGSDLTIITTGSEVRPCLDAANALDEGGISARVVDMHTIHPLDRQEILAAARDTGAVLTVEEHNVTGGLGSAVAETLMEAGMAARFHRHGIPNEYVILGPPAALYAHYRLDADGVRSVVVEWLSS